MGMSPGALLASCDPIAFVASTDAERARVFYRDVLGLTLSSEDLPFALVFDLNGTMLRVTMVREFSPAPFTVLGWKVPDIVDAAGKLRNAGVVFERFPGMEQDEHGIWSAPGARVAWFKDPDGNVLSISQH